MTSSERALMISDIIDNARSNATSPACGYDRSCELIATLERAAAEDMRKRCVKVCRKLETQDKARADTQKGGRMRRLYFFGASTAQLCASRISVLNP